MPELLHGHWEIVTGIHYPATGHVHEIQLEFWFLNHYNQTQNAENLTGPCFYITAFTFF